MNGMLLNSTPLNPAKLRRRDQLFIGNTIPRQINWRHLPITKTSFVQFKLSKITGAIEAGTTEVSLYEEDTHEVDPAEISITEVGPAEVGTFKISISEVGLSEVGTFKIKTVSRRDAYAAVFMGNYQKVQYRLHIRANFCAIRVIFWWMWGVTLRAAQKVRTKAGTVIEYKGKTIKDVRRTFMRAAEQAGLYDVEMVDGKQIRTVWCTPHILKHSAISWLAELDWSAEKISDFTNTHINTVKRVYRKTNPEQTMPMANDLAQHLQISQPVVTSLAKQEQK